MAVSYFFPLFLHGIFSISEKMVKKKTNKKSKNIKEAIGLQNILSNEKTDFLLGIILFALSIYVIIAMISYFSTGQADQSALEGMRPGQWLNTNHEFTNYCGSFGAIIAYALITLNFGLPAFFIPAFTVLVALQLMGAYRINLLKWFFGMAVVMIWSSVTFAKFLTPIMGNQVFNPGGNHGAYCVQHLENLVGSPGLTAILALVAIVFLTFLSAETITVIRKTLNPGLLMNKIKFSVTNNKEPENIYETPRDPEPATVIDTTVFDNPEEEKGKSDNTTTKPSSNEPSVTVGRGKEEEKADGKRVAAETDLSKPINPREPFTRYKFPTLSLLKKYDNDGKPEVDMEEIKANNNRIVEVLSSFGVSIREIKCTVGPTITLYEITPAEGVRIARIRNLEDDIALSLAALGIRIIAPMPGKGTIGIEVPNKKPNIVSMESILNSRKFQESTMELPIALGKTITNEVYMADLAKIPHLLVAGATGQGKSVGLNAIITSLLYKKHPNELKFVLVDPKKVEFSVYASIADHFMACLPENDEEPIITDVTKVVRTLNALCALMDKRYNLLKMVHAKNIKEYNQKYVNHQLNLTDGHDYMPYIVVIIDEFGDLIMTAGKEIERPICRIAQLARAVGIHMVIATQRPTTNIITGTIKANFPGRMAFRVMSQIDSRTILDQKGADQLVGRGDMLIKQGGDPVRVQCAFVDTPEVERINEYIEDQPGPQEPMELPEPVSEESGSGPIAGGGGGSVGKLDSLFEQAARFIVNTQQGSTSMIQRNFEIGYNRAGRLMDSLHKAGIVGPAQGSKPRDVLIADESQLNAIFEQLRNA